MSFCDEQQIVRAMLKRKIETDLAQWKKSEDKKPLVIKVVRQCGKTYIVRKFAKEDYDNFTNNH